MFSDPYGRAFLLPDIVIKMLNITTPQLPSNIVAFMTAPSVPVDQIQEIQIIYNVSFRIAVDIYEEVGERYTDEIWVAAKCGIASPSYLAQMKGGLSC
jgi:hypothetical protein